MAGVTSVVVLDEPEMPRDGALANSAEELPLVELVENLLQRGCQVHLRASQWGPTRRLPARANGSTHFQQSDPVGIDCLNLLFHRIVLIGGAAVRRCSYSPGPDRSPGKTRAVESSHGGFT